MPVSRKQHVLIFISTASLILLFTVGLFYMVVKGGRGPRGGGDSANNTGAIPDARLRDLLANPETRLEAATQAGERKP